MFQKDLGLSDLFDIYAPLLTEKKREVFLMYYSDDLSLAEIAEQTGTSRQAVRDLLGRTGDELRSFEKALGLYEKFKTLPRLSDSLSASREKITDSDARRAADSLTAAIGELL